MPALADFSRHLPTPTVQHVFFADRRSQFVHSVETLPDWFLLGIQAGSFGYRLGNEPEGLCHPGDFVLCPPGVPLARSVVQAVDFHTIRFRWKPLNPEAWRGRWTPRDGARFHSTLSSLRLSREALDPQAMTGWVQHLLTDLLFQLAHDVHIARASAKAAPDRLMLRAEEQLRRELAKPIPLEDLAAQLRLSPYQFSRRFRAAFGVAPSLYRTRLRIREARRLLLETDWTTDRVAEACGFENAFYFSRVFTRQMGQAPRDFRREHRV